MDKLICFKAYDTEGRLGDELNIVDVSSNGRQTSKQIVVIERSIKGTV